MAQLATVGCKVSGHDLCPETSIVTGDEFFKVSGKAVAVVGSLCASHSCKDHGSHQDAISAGAPHFTVNGKPVARVGDAVDHGNSVASGVGFIDVGNNGGTQCGLAISYEAVSNCLIHYIQREQLPASETDATILATPKIALNMAETDDEERRWGWKLLAPLLQKWICSDAYDELGINIDKNPEKVETYILEDLDWDKLLSIKRVKDNYRKLVMMNEPENDEEKESRIKALYEYLPQALIDCSPDIWEGGGNFDHSTVDPHLYKRCSFHSKNVANKLNFDAATIAFANFSLKALASGKVVVNDDGSRTISIVRLYIYLDDRFNFEGEAFLGFWNRSILKFKMIALDGSWELSNSAFRGFRSRHDKGGDFWVLSRPRESPEFVPFSYTIR